MGSSATPPPPPDLSRYETGAANVGDEAMKFAKEQMAYGQQQQQMLSEFTDQAFSQMFPAIEDQFDFGRKLQERYETVFQPLEDQLIAEAERYQSPEEIARQRAKAVQDVQSAGDAKRASAMRRLESYGVDPTELRYQALDKQARVEETAMAALAANQADERTREIGRNLRAQAIDVGTGVRAAGQNANQLGANMVGIGGQTAAGLSNAGVNAGAAGVPYLGVAGQGYESGANIASQGYDNEVTYAQEQRAAESDLGGFGSAVGMALPYLPIPGAQALAGIVDNDKKTGTATGRSRAADGGLINAPGTSTSDSGIIRISDGEYVIPADVVNKMGALQLDKFVEKTTQRPAPKPKTALPA
jgi:hypothetical protein